MRTDIQTRLLSYLPKGARVTNIMPYRANPDQLLIEYVYDGVIRYTSPKRRSFKEYVYYGHNGFYRQEGLTYNDLYEIYSKRFNLDFIKGEDYDDNPNPIGESNWVYLPLSRYSLRYLPESITMLAYTWIPYFNYDSDQTDLSHLNINPYATPGLKKDLFRLSGHLFDGSDITCFTQGFISIDFRNKILETLQGESDDIKREILTAVLISKFNDGVSDVMLLNGISDIPFIIRYVEH